MSKTTFRFIGADKKRAKVKLSWSQEVQAAVLKAALIDKLKAVDAFEVGRKLWGVEALPPSYSNKNAGSVLWNLKKRFGERVEKGDKETIEAGIKFGLISEGNGEDVESVLDEIDEVVEELEAANDD